MGGTLGILYSHKKTKGFFFFFFLPSTRNLCFGRLSCSKYLLGTTANNLLCCWNLLTCSCKAPCVVYMSQIQICSQMHLLHLIFSFVLKHNYTFLLCLSPSSCLLSSVEWSTSMDISLLLADPLSENMVAFCRQAGCTDCKL